MLSGNRFAQELLERNVRVAQYLMGIGAGADVQSSGERRVVRLAVRAGAQPLCIMDVGANIGQFLLVALAELAGRVYRVHCFEPARAAYAGLAAAYGDRADVILNRLALGRRDGMATLHYDRRGSGLASLTRRHVEHLGIVFNDAEEVMMDTLDQYCGRAGIERIDLLKIDVEGHELDVLVGGQRMFAKGGVSIVTFEFGGCNVDSRSFWRDFYSWFDGVGMSVYRVTPSGYLRELTRYRESDEQFRTTNFVGVRRQLAAPLLAVRA
jgi:FkbM family methyltransferase